ncbi:MAG: homocysteine S-methyltransferase family protein [Clostridiales bacterium]|nr:homocysteine S-methyltransferase family protein [Clostridiales bacterium]
MDDVHLRLPLILDGATGTNLEEYGFQEGDSLPLFAREHGEAVAGLQRAYAVAGAGAVLAPTYGANRTVLARHGYTGDPAALNRSLAAATRRAVGPEVLVGGDLSMTGLRPAPFGEIPFAQIVADYAGQAAGLAAGGADFLLCEGMTNMWEARAAALGCRSTGLPVFITMSLNEDGESPEDLPFLSFMATVQALGAAAVGMNSFSDYDRAAHLLDQARRYARVPLVVRPAAGRSSGGLSPAAFALVCEGLYHAGAEILGGCIRTDPAHIAALKGAVAKTAPLPPAQPEDVWVAADDRDVYFLNDDDILPSQPIPCGYDMGEDLIEAERLEDGLINTVRIRVNSRADALLLAQYAYMSKLPVMLQADSPEALQEALLLYQGRALVDSGSEMEPETLRRIAAAFGAIVY